MAQVHIIVEMDNEDFHNENILGDIEKLPYVLSTEMTDFYLDEEG